MVGFIHTITRKAAESGICDQCPVVTVSIVPGTPPGAGGERNRYCPPRVSDPGGELSLKISSPPAGWGGTTCLKEEMFWGGHQIGEVFGF